MPRGKRSSYADILCPYPDTYLITVVQRFLASVQWSTTEFYENTPCLIWTGMKGPRGYGVINAASRHLYAHRFAVAITTWDDPSMVTDHLCRNHACCNTAHLQLVTDYGNVHAPGSQTVSALHAAKTHCPHGHEYDTENTFFRKGSRECKTCVRATDRARYKRQKR